MARASRAKFEIAPFEPPPPPDPLADEHAVVAGFVENALHTTHRLNAWADIEFGDATHGRQITEAKGEQARRYLLAAMAQLRHWERETARVQSQAETEFDRVHSGHLAGWQPVWTRRRLAEGVCFHLMRRALPLQSNDLVVVIDLILAAGHSNEYTTLVPGTVRALKKFAAEQPIPSDLLAAMRRFAALLRAEPDKRTARLGTDIEQLFADTAAEPSVAPTRRDVRPVVPGQAGNPRVLVTLKRKLGIADPTIVETVREELQPDHFPLVDGCALEAEHRIISQVLRAMLTTPHGYVVRFTVPAVAATIRDLSTSQRARLLLAGCERVVEFPGTRPDDDWRISELVLSLPGSLADLGADLSRDLFFDYVLFLGVAQERTDDDRPLGPSWVARRAVEFAAEEPLSEGERYALHLYRSSIIGGPQLGSPTPTVVALTQAIGDGQEFFLVPGDVWSDSVNADLGQTSGSTRKQWAAFLRHMVTATSARPSAKWLKAATDLAAPIGAENIRSAVLRWLALVPRGSSRVAVRPPQADPRRSVDVIHEENALCLRGMLWCLATLPPDGDAARVICAAAVSAYKKVPGVGPRAVKVGNGAVYALSALGTADAVGQLAILKARVKFGTAQKEIEKAFNAAAGKLGLPRDEIEEIGVPTYGLEEVGKRTETFGEYTASLVIGGSRGGDAVAIEWAKGDGKALKSAPAAVKKEHTDDLKELSQAVKDIGAMLPAQRERIDSLFLSQRSWPADVWRERYLDHPLVGTLARRLIWTFTRGDAEFDAIYLDGDLVGRNGRKLSAPDASTRVALWHPIGRSVEEVLAWRAMLEKHEIRQPFKQAHREVYVLTDAERNTRVYSNRFAAHVIRQHQFNALCAARGWKNKLRLMVDDSYPAPSRLLPAWSLRAEFWVESIGDDYGVDTNESGVFHRVATDQVRFYAADANPLLAHASGGGYERAYGEAAPEPLPLDQVPPLVFSEILRDVDMFVGVASVGNDPTWQDGGPDGRFRDYWQQYSFGQLSATAETRRTVLERLIPRLAIADRCSFADRFLVVRGDLRTYKIHLGSSNILMEPNDQYLCIVPGRGAGGSSPVYLPFEGDERLAVILSKALMLAEDTKIKDSSILSQIRRS